MKEFALLFRMDITTKELQPSEEQMQQYMSDWIQWMNDITDKGQMADGGNHFSKSGKVLRPQQTVTNGPYTVNKESVAGYIIILAKNMDDAMLIAKECPILKGEGTSVEIRETATP